MQFNLLIGGGTRAHFPDQRLAILCLLTEGPFALTMEITMMQPLVKLPTLSAIKYWPVHVAVGKGGMISRSLLL